MKKILLISLIILTLPLAIYFNYQTMLEEKSKSLEEFREQFGQAIPEFTQAAEVEVDKIKEEAQIEIESPFKIGDEIKVEADKIVELEIGSKENLAKKVNKDNQADLSEDIKDKINLAAVIKYSDISIARLEVNGKEDNYIEGDKINNLSLKEIATTKVVLSKNDKEFLIEMYD